MFKQFNLSGFRRRAFAAFLLAGGCLSLILLGLEPLLIVIVCWSSATEVLVMADFSARRQAVQRQLPPALRPLIKKSRYFMLAALSVWPVIPVIRSLMPAGGADAFVIVAASCLTAVAVLLFYAYRAWPDRSAVDRVLVGWSLISVAGVLAAEALTTAAAELLFIIIVAVVTDIAAMLFGRFGSVRFPKRLIPALSPGKTVIGLFGGAGCGLMTAALLLAPEHLLPAAIAVLFAVVSDLLFSHHKRMAFVKDSGAWIAGHGGTIDRCDSVIGAVAAYFMFKKFILLL